MANAFVRLFVQNTYYKCMFSLHPDAILEIRHPESPGKTTSAKLFFANTMVCDLHFPTAAHTSWFSTCFSSAPRATIRRTRLAAAGCGESGEMQNATRVAFASNSSRCGRLRREHHLCSGCGTHKLNLRSACNKSVIKYISKRKLKSLKGAQCSPGASCVRSSAR